MHPRTGLDTEYLSDEFMEMIKACCDKAEAEQMLAWLYDEDRWSSGPAGGKVTRHKKFRRKRLTLFTAVSYTHLDVYKRQCPYTPPRESYSCIRDWHSAHR